MYYDEPLECVESLKYIGLEVPSNYTWNEYATCLLEGERDHSIHLRSHVIIDNLSFGSSRNTFLTL